MIDANPFAPPPPPPDADDAMPPAPDGAASDASEPADREPAPDAPDTPAADAAPPAPARPSIRNDGWTPDRQARFLAAIAEGHLVRDACRMVGLTPTSAYAFRRRANGAAFALGWAAANLHAREVLADTLLARAMEGQVETITRSDGSVVERHRYDNRLAQAMLTRLDRLAAADPAAPAIHSRAADASPAPHGIDPLRAARGVAAGFDAYLDLIADDAGPARAQLFVAGAVQPAAPGLSALAQADRRLRATDPVADAAPAPSDPPRESTSTTSPPPPRNHALLDPADRAGWTATDWARAEAAGLLAFAAPATPAPAAPAPATPAAPASAPPARIGLSDLPKGELDAMMKTFEGRTKLLEYALAICDEPGPPAPGDGTYADDDSDAEEDAEDEAPAPPRVWREDADTWRTNFIAPPDFDGWHEFDYGDPEYVRDLTDGERDIAERWEASDPARIAAAAERDAWFAAGGSPWGPVADDGPALPGGVRTDDAPPGPDAPPAAPPPVPPAAPATEDARAAPETVPAARAGAAPWPDGPPASPAGVLHRLFPQPAPDRSESPSVPRILPGAGSLRSHHPPYRETSA